MKFRPCIDIHNGKVKQIVGGSLADKNNSADENFVSHLDGDYYGKLYKSFGLNGGHIILLNPVGSQFYEADCLQAEKALSTFNGGLQLGGGINCDNAERFIDMGASHVIVTSYVFKDGAVNFDNLKALNNRIGKNRIVLDLSCRKRNDDYYIVTDRWQKFTDITLTEKTIAMLSDYCDEFLIHAVDVEGKAKGIEENIAELMGNCDNVKSTYAGGISSFDDLEILKKLGKSHVDFTIGSALDIFGGNMKFEDVVKYCIGD